MKQNNLRHFAIVSDVFTLINLSSLLENTIPKYYGSNLFSISRLAFTYLGDIILLIGSDNIKISQQKLKKIQKLLNLNSF